MTTRTTTKVFLRRVDGSRKNKTTARICLPEKFNEPLIIGREQKRGSREEGGGGGGRGGNNGEGNGGSSMTPVFVGLENEPMVEDEHVQVTKMRLGERTSGVAVQVKAIGKSAVYIQSDSKTISQLKRNSSALLLKGQTMFLGYENKEFRIAFVVEEEKGEEEGNGKPIEVLEIEESDSSPEKNGEHKDEKKEEEDVEVVDSGDEKKEKNGFVSSRDASTKRVLHKKKISRKESLVSSSSDDEFSGQGKKTFVIEDDDDSDDDDNDNDDDSGGDGGGNEERPNLRKKIVLDSSSSSSSSSRSRRMRSSENQEDGDSLTSEKGEGKEEEEEEKEMQEKKEEEPSTHPSGPSLFNLIHKKLEKETFKARSAASKKAAQTMKKRRASGKDDYDDDYRNDEWYGTEPEDDEVDDKEEGDIIARVKRKKKAVEKSNPNKKVKKMKPVASSPIIIGSSDEEEKEKVLDSDIDAYDFEERETIKNKKKRSTEEVVGGDLDNNRQSEKRKKVSDAPKEQKKDTASKTTKGATKISVASAKSTREIREMSERNEENIRRQKIELEKQVREQQRRDELEEQRAREERIRRQQEQHYQQSQHHHQHPPYTGEYQDDVSVVTSYARMLDASAELKYFEANDLQEATRQYEEASKQYSKKTYQSAKGPAFATLQQRKTNLQTTSFKHAQLKMEYSEASQAHKLAMKHAAAAAAAAAATATQSKRRKATAAEESMDEKRWTEEKLAWDACFINEDAEDANIDLHRDTIAGWSIRDLKRRGALIGADFSSAIEKSEYIDAIVRRITAIGGKSGWLRRKRHKDASIETGKRQREKLKAYQDSTAIDIEAESATRRLQHQARKTVEKWSHRADLRLFLVRCGVDVEGGERGKSDKKTLQKAYKRAMMKFHPDRQHAKAEKDRVLAVEVTKYINEVWAGMK